LGVPLDPLAKQGFRSALDYERGRLGYPQEAVDTIVAKLDLDRSSRVLDLAAGTGQLARQFLPGVGTVVAVEPSEAMRRVLAQAVPAAGEILARVATVAPSACVVKLRCDYYWTRKR
jgi:predicted RNA methylase